MKTLNKAVARYNGISLIVRILIGLIVGAVLALVVTLVVFTLSQRKKARLQNPHDSYHGRYRA